MCFRPQEMYLKRMAVLMEQFYSKGDDIEEEAWRLWQERYTSSKQSDRIWFDIGWLQHRRSNLERWQHYCRMWQQQIRAEGRQLALQVRSLLHATSNFLCSDFYQLEPWVKDVMEEALSQESEELEMKYARWDQDSWAGSLKHLEARENYRIWIAHFSGRAASKGLPTGRDVEPEALLNEFPRDFGEREFAKKFMWLGGYQAPSQVDKHGWTALMHACNFLVYWTKAFETCKGLIDMMEFSRIVAIELTFQPDNLTRATMHRNNSNCCTCFR